MKSALHDQMSLSKQIQTLEEENINNKTIITKLSRELEDRDGNSSFSSRISQIKEDKDKHLIVLEKEIIRLYFMSSIT